MLSSSSDDLWRDDQLRKILNDSSKLNSRLAEATTLGKSPPQNQSSDVLKSEAEAIKSQHGKTVGRKKADALDQNELSDRVEDAMLNADRPGESLSKDLTSAPDVSWTSRTSFNTTPLRDDGTENSDLLSTPSLVPPTIYYSDDPPSHHSRNSINSTSLHSQHSTSSAAPLPPLAPGAASTVDMELTRNSASVMQSRARPIKSQYPVSGGEKHVEYILVASFDIDKGSVMEHQYPGPVGGDEVMLAELMLPDQTHARSQDWTIFFLRKDAEAMEEASEEGRGKWKKRRRKVAEDDGQAGIGATDGQAKDEGLDHEDYETDSSDEEPRNMDGPPLVYVLNLVNTKTDNTVKRGAIVKALAVCTRHSFLHIYKPLLLIALDQYFSSPTIETLASLYDAVNGMDLSLMPRLNLNEKFILQASNAKDLFIGKFEAMIAQRMVSDASDNGSQRSVSPTLQQFASHSRYSLPEDTHEFESTVNYANIPIPVRIPVALSPETVGDFSLIKLITTFSTPHSTSPIPFHPTHPHLTTSGSSTHPMIVLLNALLTQKRVIFLGHNLPSSEVAEAVLAACALASGGLLRGFTRHAFPYTDLTKIDDLLKVPGFIAGVANPAFAHHSEWWDVFCDIHTGRVRISNKIGQPAVTEGVVFFQQNAFPPTAGSGAGMSAIAAAGASLHAGLGGVGAHSASSAGADLTGDAIFMSTVLSAIHERHGENAIRTIFRLWVARFTRLAAAFEESVYGASALHIHDPPGQTELASPLAPLTSPAVSTPHGFDQDFPPEVLGHGYVWPSPQLRHAELAANSTRIEGWRVTRSYYNFVQDLAAFYHTRPVKALDLHHLHDKLVKLRLGPDAAGNIYLAICVAVQTKAEISQLLATIANGSWDSGAGSAGMGQGLFYIAYGLCHSKIEVREAVASLLGRVREHEAGRHFWNALGGSSRVAWEKVVIRMQER
jgi:hypothetical protein